jgi:hypothetical protein
VLNVKVDNDKPFEYKLELMDHNIKMIYVNDKQSIVIQKDSYEISLLSEAKGETTEEEVAKEVISEAKEVISEAQEKEELSEAQEKEELSEAKSEALEVETKETKEVESKEAKSEAKDNGLDASTIYY